MTDNRTCPHCLDPLKDHQETAHPECQDQAHHDAQEAHHDH